MIPVTVGDDDQPDVLGFDSGRRQLFDKGIGLFGRAAVHQYRTLIFQDKRVGNALGKGVNSRARWQTPLGPYRALSDNML